MSLPETKISQLRALAASADWRGAILLAAKFQELGTARGAILSAREAYLRPEFQRQIGRCPDVLIECGRAALRDRYGV